MGEGWEECRGNSGTPSPPPPFSPPSPALTRVPDWGGEGRGGGSALLARPDRNVIDKRLRADLDSFRGRGVGGGAVEGHGVCNISAQTVRVCFRLRQLRRKGTF